ncbi:MAG: Choline dehydrogenase (EC [uncultured Caballeronia sp.]|nr:MAG: Choline dehydrogenase (EC [uncultured Caballeronia sp.]
MSAPALAKFSPEEILPGPAFQTDAEFAVATGKVRTTIFFILWGHAGWGRIMIRLRLLMGVCV